MKDVLWDDRWVHRMSSSSLGRGIGAGTDGRDASEKHQRDFIPANVVTHEEVTEGVGRGAGVGCTWNSMVAKVISIVVGAGGSRAWRIQLQLKI